MRQWRSFQQPAPQRRPDGRRPRHQMRRLDLPPGIQTLRISGLAAVLVDRLFQVLVHRYFFALAGFGIGAM
jgi:hypothetical protein